MDNLSFINTKIDFLVEEDEMEQESQEKLDALISMDDIKAEIRKELLLETEKERKKIIELAKDEAEKIRIESRQSAYEEGFNKGYEQGYEKGINDAQDEAQTIKKNAVALIEQAKQYVTEYYAENQERIIKLAADMAENIINFTIDTSSENIIMLIKPILQQFGDEESIIISCHPDNSDYVKGRLRELKDICQTAKFIILEDKNLERNGCIIENEHQIIDLQIRKQIAYILEEIKNSE